MLHFKAARRVSVFYSFRIRELLAAFTFIVCVFVGTNVNAQSTEFVYQGQLQNSSAPANGNFDFEFLLFDTLSGPNQIGSTLTKSGGAVANGIFSVKLDFGANYPGSARFLEIHVRQTGGGAFTSLTPRQPVSSSPYSIKSLTADTATTAANSAQLGGVAASQFVQTNDSRLTDERNPLSGSSNYVQNGTTQQAASNFNISGEGRAGTFRATAFDALAEYRIAGSAILRGVGDNIALGTATGDPSLGIGNTYAGARSGQAATSNASGNSFFGFESGKSNSSGFSNSFFGQNAGQSNTGGARNVFMGVYAGAQNTAASENTFVGEQSGGVNTTGGTNSFFGRASGPNNSTGAENTFVGWLSGSVNVTGNSNTAFGYRASFTATNLTNANAIGYRALVSQSNSLVLGSINGSNGATADTNVGIGTTAPSQRLHVVGNGLFSGNLTGNNVDAVTQFNIGGNRIVGSDGPNNTFTGFGAGAGTTAFSGGVNNSFFGSNAGNLNMNGSYNSFFGVAAGASNTAGQRNTFVGDSAGTSNDIGSDNTAIGYGANVGFNGLSNATAIGSKAYVVQNNSIVLGSIAGVNGAAADTNVGIGTTAPSQKLHVIGNGFFSGSLTVVGTLNAALPGGSSSYIQNGASQQASSTFNISGTGTANIFNAASQYNIGGNRVLSVAGAQNVFVGNSAGVSNTTGQSNAFFGQLAGQVNTSGQSNTFVGRASGFSNSTGTDNAFFGSGSGFSNTIGNSNSFFGKNAGFSNTTAQSNAFYGDNAGFSNTTGGSNAFFGPSSGAANTTGSQLTMVGLAASPLSTNLTNATAIGAQAAVNQSNSLVLGSISGVNGAGANTNVGIGTTTPQAALHVNNGSIRVTNGGMYIANPNTLIITSPNGACWGITVNNAGGLATFPVNPCP